MAYDAHKNFAASIVAVAPVPAASGTSLTVAAGHGAKFPAVPFNCTVWPDGISPTSTNAEIVRVTNVTGDVLTIVRNQEGSMAQAIAAGYQIANTATNFVFTQIENSIIQEIVAGGGTAFASQVSFADANGVSFGANGQTITASFSAGTGGGGGVAISAGGDSQSTGTIIFSNSNGMAFGLAAGTLTASYTVPVVTPQTTQPVAVQGGSDTNASFLFSTLVLSNSNGVTFGTNPGNFITASIGAVPGQSTQPVAAAASNGSFLFSTLSFVNASNVTFGTSAGGIIFASVASTTPQSVQPVAVAAPSSNSSFLFSTLNFSNSNGVTFGTNPGGFITASVGAGVSPGSIIVSDTTVSLGAVVFLNSPTVTFGIAGSTITASVASVSTTLGGGTMSFWEPTPFNNAHTSFTVFPQNTMLIDPLALPCALSFTRINFFASVNAIGNSSNAGATASAGYSVNVALYSRSVTESAATNFSNSSNLVLMASVQQTYSGQCSASGSSITMNYGWRTGSTNGSTSSSQSSFTLAIQNPTWTGQKLMPIGFATSLTAGEYWLAQFWSSTSGGAAFGSDVMSFRPIQFTAMTNGSWASDFGAATNSQFSPVRGLGVFSVTSAAFPTSMASNAISGQSLNRRAFNFQA